MADLGFSRHDTNGKGTVGPLMQTKARQARKGPCRNLPLLPAFGYLPSSRPTQDLFAAGVYKKNWVLSSDVVDWVFC